MFVTGQKPQHFAIALPLSLSSVIILPLENQWRALILYSLSANKPASDISILQQ
jgi:hypothetical protein